uniref:C2H2-type domain-containing protein n=1 Tax=Petromyzon marinus TaxID=7757 RepID=S4RB29_PETMA
EDTGEKLFKCNVCGKAFSRSLHLKNQQKYTQVRSPTSTVCGKAYTEIGTLRTHQRTHSGEKPFKGEKLKCNVCGKAFLRSLHLKNQQKIHTGENPYNCGVHGRAFRDN